MDKQALEDHVIKALAGHQNRSDIIKFICLEMNLSWPEAENILGEIELNSSQTIFLRKLPIIGIMSIALFVSGMALEWYSIHATLDGLVFTMPQVPIPYSGNISLIVLGVFLMMGGVLGLVELRKQHS